jgi:SecD/SecF fusion protein
LGSTDGTGSFTLFPELNQLVKAKGDSIGVAKTTNLTNLIQLNSTPGNAVANVKLSDTAVVNKILKCNCYKSSSGKLKYTQFMWGYKPENNTSNSLVLYAIRGNINQKLRLTVL